MRKVGLLNITANKHYIVWSCLKDAYFYITTTKWKPSDCFKN